jgi:hypothetical protein
MEITTCAPVRKTVSLSDKVDTYKKMNQEEPIMFLENFWEYLLSAILLWIALEEFVLKSMPGPSLQPQLERRVNEDIRPV